MEMKECCFCAVNKGKYARPDIDTPFMSDENYFALASVGAMVEGWSLIIPRAHGVSLKLNYTNPHLGIFLNKLLPKLIGQYGKLIAFEHGANMDGSLTGCGINHAHLHLVPSVGSLRKEMRSSGLKWEDCLASQIADRVGDKEYLYYAELSESAVWENPAGQLHELRSPESQYFRKLIAQKLEMPGNYDYKKHPNRAVAAKTQKVLASV